MSPNFEYSLLKFSDRTTEQDSFVFYLFMIYDFFCLSANIPTRYLIRSGTRFSTNPIGLGQVPKTRQNVLTPKRFNSKAEDFINYLSAGYS